MKLFFGTIYTSIRLEQCSMLREKVISQELLDTVGKKKAHIACTRTFKFPKNIVDDLEKLSLSIKNLKFSDKLSNRLINGNHSIAIKGYSEFFSNNDGNSSHP